MDEIEIWLTAAILLAAAPNDAPRIAAALASDNLEQADESRARMWRRVADALRNLERHNARH